MGIIVSELYKQQRMKNQAIRAMHKQTELVTDTLIVSTDDKEEREKLSETKKENLDAHDDFEARACDEAYHTGVLHGQKLELASFGVGLIVAKVIWPVVKSVGKSIFKKK